MASFCKKSICQGVLMIGESRPKVPLFLSFHTKGNPTIMVRTFITVEDISNASNVKERMFITVDGPLEASERREHRCLNLLQHLHGSCTSNFLSNKNPSKTSGQSRGLHNLRRWRPLVVVKRWSKFSY